MKPSIVLQCEKCGTDVWLDYEYPGQNPPIHVWCGTCTQKHIVFITENVTLKDYYRSFQNKV